MQDKRRTHHGFTMLEILLVIAIISLLMALLVMGLGKMRVKTQKGQARNLIEKVNNGLEAYFLNFRAYPPDTINGLTNSEALYYFLATPFRKSPDLSKGEVLASINVGPLVSFEEKDLKVSGGNTQIVDPWQTPLSFRIDDSTTDSLGFKILRPVIYSWGINKVDDTTAGTIPSDDITIGAQD